MGHRGQRAGDGLRQHRRRLGLGRRVHAQPGQRREKEFYGEFLINAQGEDVVAGVRTPEPVAELKKQMPKAYAELERIRQTLEKHFKDVQDFEFTIEDGVVYMLQTRNGKRTAMAALKFSMDMLKEKLIDWKTAVMRNPADQLEQLLAPVFDAAEVAKAKAIATGPAGRSGRGVRPDLPERRSRRGRRPTRARRCCSSASRRRPEDLRGMIAAEGILTARGGVSSHAALVARQMGKVCVCGAAAVEVDYQARTVTVDGQTFKEGDWMSIDGTAGKVYAGQVKTAPSEIVAGLINGDEAAQEDREVQELPAADEVVLGRDAHGVRTNADTPEQTENAVAFGAVGIGLCRTEHMFFEGDRIDAMREMILAETVEARKAALAKLLPYQREDFAGIFRALKGYPATIRFLDPPLHEFLPHTKEQQAELAKKIGVPASRASTRASSSCTSSTRCSASAAAASASAIRRSRRCRRAPCSRRRRGPEGRHQGPARDHDPARRLQEGARSADRGRAPGGARGAGRAEGQAELPGRHDDRDPARRADRRRDRAVGRVLQLRHQRPDADRPRHVARRLGLVPAAVYRSSRS